MSGGRYEIIDNPYLDLEGDISSIWEFFSKDIVRCIEKKGDLIACELMESTFPNRKIHDLIFNIVKNLGEIKLDELKGFYNEIKFLCANDKIIQKQHPVVKKWLKLNCFK